jgi:hypothetical protein
VVCGTIQKKTVLSSILEDMKMREKNWQETKGKDCGAKEQMEAFQPLAHIKWR